MSKSRERLPGPWQKGGRAQQMSISLSIVSCGPLTMGLPFKVRLLVPITGIKELWKEHEGPGAPEFILKKDGLGLPEVVWWAE
jgi:hypothetical protein